MYLLCKKKYSHFAHRVLIMHFVFIFWFCFFVCFQTTSLTHSSSSSPPTTRSSSPPPSSLRSSSITSPPVGANQGSPTNCAPRCCDTGRPLFTDPLTGQTICSCQYDILNYQRLAASGATGLPTLSMYGSPYPEGMAAYFPALSADQSPFYTSAVSTTCKINSPFKYCRCVLEKMLTWESRCNLWPLV